MNQRINRCLGKSWAAWKGYPNLRKRIANVSNGPPIIVTGMHRSGTSWVGEMLAASGLWYLYEPFAPRNGLWHESYSYIAAEDNDVKFDNLLSKALSGSMTRFLHLPDIEASLSPVRIFPQFNKRVLVKEPNIALCSEYILRKHNCRILFTFRHPLAFAESVARHKWPQRQIVRRILEDDELMADWLSPFRETLVKHRDSEGLMTSVALHGAINKVLHCFMSKEKSIESLIFEDLCIDPMNEFRQLFQKLNLPYNEYVISRHKELCFSLVNSSDHSPHETKRESRKQADRWKKVLSEQEITTAREVWDNFEIPLYQDDKDWNV